MNNYFISICGFYTNGIYSEPLYDENPSLGDHSFEVNPFIPKNTIIRLNDEGYIENVYGVDFTYGVSLHSGTLIFTENMKKHINIALRSLTSAQADKIINEQIEYRGHLHNYQHWSYNLDLLEFYAKNDLRENCSNIQSKDEYENASKDLWENVFYQMQSIYNMERANLEMKMIATKLILPASEADRIPRPTL